MDYSGPNFAPVRNNGFVHQVVPNGSPPLLQVLITHCKTNQMEVFDYHRDLRATIDDDGTVRNVQGNVVGYINEDGTCGDVYEFASILNFLSLFYQTVLETSSSERRQSSTTPNAKNLFFILFIF